MMTRLDFRVVGRGPIPLGMLRYDAAWPRSQDDVTAALDEEHERGVWLSTYGRVSEGRWHSFGWRVTAIYKDAGRGSRLIFGRPDAEGGR